MSQKKEHKAKVLVFCRNYLIPDFYQMFNPLIHEYDIEYLTDQKCKHGTQDTRRAFYKYLSSSTRCAELDLEAEDDVIARCRLLRNLERAQASKMTHAMAQVICDVFEEKQPDMLFTHMVDEYILHLFCLLAKRRNIAYAAYCGSYFPGHVLIFGAHNGAALTFRNPGEEEVDEVLKLISPVEFRQNYFQVKEYNLMQHLRLMSRYFGKKLIFPLKAMLEKDPWGMHYRIVPFTADRKRLRDFPDKNDFIYDWKKKLKELKTAHPYKSVIYLPLAYSPEATTDYWVENKCIINYEEKIVDIINMLALDFIVLVKEHAHMMGARNVALHKSLKVMNSVISIHPNALGNEVLLSSDAVILGSGSVGVEAFLRDKPVFTYCKSSYWFKPSKAYYLDLDNIEGWVNALQNQLSSFVPAKAKEKKACISNCLKSTGRRKRSRW